MLHLLSDEVMSEVDVLGPLMVNRICGESHTSSIVILELEGLSILKPSFSNMRSIQIACLAASEVAMYSASVVDRPPVGVMCLTLLASFRLVFLESVYTLSSDFLY